MSVFTQFVGGGRISSIINRDSSGGTSNNLTSASSLTRQLSSGSTGAAGTLTTILSVTGRGTINFCAPACADATARTIRLKITVDGVSIFDATSSSISTANHGIVGIGAFNYTTAPFIVFQPINFYTSLLVQIASSVSSETDKINTFVNYEINA